MDSTTPRQGTPATTPRAKRASLRVDIDVFWDAMKPVQKAWLAGNAAVGLLALLFGICGKQQSAMVTTAVAAIMFGIACFEVWRIEHYRRLDLECRFDHFASVYDGVLVTMHHGFGDGKAEKEAYFLSVTNNSSADITITHAWLASEPQLHSLESARPLPKLLGPSRKWEVWFLKGNIPPITGANILELGRVRLSTNQVLCSSPAQDVPAAGFVPGAE